jgi:hypothetical protein
MPLTRIQSLGITDGTIVNADINASAGIVTSKLSGALGITEADQWRLSADNTYSSASDITTNWERNDTDFSLIGTGMTQSSGIFTFPSTGIYLVTINATGENNAASDYIQISLNTTTNNSTYNVRAMNYQHATGSGKYMGWYANAIFDVTSTANCKVKFRMEQIQSGTVLFQGSSVANRTYATFIRLGDT